MGPVNQMLDELARVDLEEIEKPWTSFLEDPGSTEVPLIPERPTVAQLLLYIACAARTQLQLTKSVEGRENEEKEERELTGRLLPVS